MINVSKIDEFLDYELNTDITDILITRDKQGKYSLYGKYTIIPESGVFKAFTPRHEEEYLFSTLVYAVSWCTLHSAKKYNYAQRIVSIDRRLVGTKMDLANQIRLLKTAVNNKLIYAIKLQETAMKRDRMLEEMASYINTSKSIQEQKFRTANHRNFRYQ